jgi:hypothetical protein
MMVQLRPSPVVLVAVTSDVPSRRALSLRDRPGKEARRARTALLR